jgi:hypothetical protein
MPALEAVNRLDNDAEYNELADDERSDDSRPYLRYPLLAAVPVISASA